MRDRLGVSPFREDKLSSSSHQVADSVWQSLPFGKARWDFARNRLVHRFCHRSNLPKGWRALDRRKDGLSMHVHIRLRDSAVLESTACQTPQAHLAPTAPPAPTHLSLQPPTSSASQSHPYPRPSPRAIAALHSATTYSDASATRPTRRSSSWRDRPRRVVACPCIPPCKCGRWFCPSCRSGRDGRRVCRTSRRC